MMGGKEQIGRGMEGGGAHLDEALVEGGKGYAAACGEGLLGELDEGHPQQQHDNLGMEDRGARYSQRGTQTGERGA